MQDREQGGEGSDEWQHVGRQMGRWDPRMVPVEVQAAKFSRETPNLVSALWGESGKSAEMATTWGDEVKW